MTIFFLLPGVVLANSAGFNNEVGDAFTMASGGAVAARAHNSSTNWSNPAGLSFLEERSFNITTLFENVAMEYNDNTGSAVEEASEDFFIPAFYITGHINSNVSYGLGVNSPYGLSLNWGNGLTKYVVNKSEIKSLYITPSLAYQFNDHFSMGAGLNIVDGEGELSKSLNLTALNTSLNLGALSPSADGSSKLIGDDTSLSFNIGMMYEFNDTNRVALVYRSKTKLDLDGTVSLSSLNGTTAAVFGGSSYSTASSLEINIPSSLTFGYLYKPCEKVAIEFDVEWTEWSVVDNFNVMYKGESNATRLAILNIDNPALKDWDDTFSFGIGVEKTISDKFSFQFGSRYRPSPVPENTADPLTPLNDLWNFDFGVSLFLKRSRLDFVVAHAWSKSRTISNTVGASSLTSVDGTYSLTARVIGLSYNYYL